MSTFKNASFGERLSTAASAKKAALEKYRAKAEANDSSSAERQAARQAIIAAREIRAAEREKVRLAKAVDDAAAQAARDVLLKAEQAARDAEAAELAERELALEVERKKARDARYAARKARK
jgi:hypothetical protein